MWIRSHLNKIHLHKVFMNLTRLRSGFEMHEDASQINRIHTDRQLTFRVARSKIADIRIVLCRNIIYQYIGQHIVDIT